MCAKMGAKFVLYKAEGGVWKFEVEHFSRYGLMDVDDDEGDEPGEAGAQDMPAAAKSAATATAARAAAAHGGTRYGLGLSALAPQSEGAMEDEDWEDVPGPPDVREPSSDLEVDVEVGRAA